jgi:hypothetical protein
LFSFLLLHSNNGDCTVAKIVVLKNGGIAMSRRKIWAQSKWVLEKKKEFHGLL